MTNSTIDRLAALLLAGGVALRAGPTLAQETYSHLAKELQNPVADLISIPLENKLDLGPGSTLRYTLNVQPVLPFEISKDWCVVSRTILPFMSAQSPVPGGSTLTGIGDVTQSFFFAPKAPVGGWILGAGPVLLLPTATERDLGAGAWGVGPTAVALRQDGAWSYGGLANHVWKVAGRSGSEVSRTTLLPFVSYTLPSLTFLGVGSEALYDAPTGRWLVPLDAGASQLVVLDGLPVVFGGGVRYYLERPAGGPDWGLKFTVTIVPRR